MIAGPSSVLTSHFNPSIIRKGDGSAFKLGCLTVGTASSENFHEGTNIITEKLECSFPSLFFDELLKSLLRLLKTRIRILHELSGESVFPGGDRSRTKYSPALERLGGLLADQGTEEREGGSGLIQDFIDRRDVREFVLVSCPIEQAGDVPIADRPHGFQRLRVPRAESSPVRQREGQSNPV